MFPLTNYPCRIVSAFVYILPHSVAPRLKIGKANNIPSRVRQIGVDQFDFSRSSALRVRTEVDAYNLERMLHKVFGRYRVPEEDIIAFEGVRPDGASEWFDDSCQPRLTQFLSENADLLGFSQLGATDVQHLVRPPAPPAPSRPSKSARLPQAGDEKKRAAREAKRLRKLRAAAFEEQDIEEGCRFADANLLPALRALVKNCPALYYLWNDDGISANLVGELPSDAPAAAMWALAALRRMPYHGKGTAMCLTTDFATCPSANGTLFLVRMGHPQCTDNYKPVIDAVRAHVASYPLRIPGWRKQMAPSLQQQAEELAACIPRFSKFYRP